MHTQHVKSSVYAWGGGMGGVGAVETVVVVVVGLEDVGGGGFEVGVVVVFFLPSPSLLLVAFVGVVLDCIDLM